MCNASWSKHQPLVVCVSSCVVSCSGGGQPHTVATEDCLHAALCCMASGKIRDLEKEHPVHIQSYSVSTRTLVASFKLFLANSVHLILVGMSCNNT